MNIIRRTKTEALLSTNCADREVRIKIVKRLFPDMRGKFIASERVYYQENEYFKKKDSVHSLAGFYPPKDEGLILRATTAFYQSIDDAIEVLTLIDKGVE